MQSDGRMGRGTERRGKKCWHERGNERGRTAWNAKGERKYAEAGCQDVAEWGHRVYRKVDGAGSVSEDDGQIRNGVIEKVHYKKITLAEGNKIIEKADGKARKYPCKSGDASFG